MTTTDEKVASGMECPACGEARMDHLICRECGLVVCGSCERVYDPATGKPAIKTREFEEFEVEGKTLFVRYTVTRGPDVDFVTPAYPPRWITMAEPEMVLDEDGRDVTDEWQDSNALIDALTEKADRRDED